MIDSQDGATSKDRALLNQLKALKAEDEMLYRILAVDVWALAKTMDEFQPGFWAAFMKNRELALKRFVQSGLKKPQPPRKEKKRPPFL